MENATKALIMAAAILLAIMIISLMVLIFNKFGDSAKEAADMTKEQIQEFNSKITPYLGDSVKGTQVNALLQYCLSSNMSAKNKGENNKEIVVTGASSLDLNSTSFSRVSTGNDTYKVKESYGNSGLINKITITKN